MVHLLLFLATCWAMPNRNSFPVTVSADHVRELIKINGQEEQLKVLGPQAYTHLRDIMFSGAESVDNRWHATLALAKIGGEESLPDLQAALKNPLWYMRAAALLGKSLVDKDHGVAIAKALMHEDPALLVRATALQVLAQQKKIDKEFLWAELYNPANFNNGRGLPIRTSILKVIDQSIAPTDSAKLTALLREQNEDIQTLAKRSLSKIYKQKTPATVVE